MLKRLTPKQRQLMVMFFNYIQENQKPPTQTYIASVLEEHPRNINQCLKYATRKGYFENREGFYYPTRDGVEQLRKDYTTSKILSELQQDNVRLVPLEDGSDAGGLQDTARVRHDISLPRTLTPELPQSQEVNR